MSNGLEKPSAFRYMAAAGTGSDDLQHRYVPLYDRTSVFLSGELPLSILFKGELMGEWERNG
ncbi:hypothetical protein [Paenibacillus sp. HB172176]|uniref:hypothetical protein n=1 Tax=Paenibacillus sp. HB172176 TaxID=2493690 RepID=UPI00143B8C1D|nr:hypothetical protein [Paenibacillus sp. HB172176]